MENLRFTFFSWLNPSKRWFFPRKGNGVGLVLSAFAMGLVTPIQAANLYFSGAAHSTWDTGGGGWSSTSGSGYSSNWGAGGSTAVFEGTGTTVTAASIPGVNGITFNADGYTLQSGTLTMTSGTITTTGVSATISSIIAGSAGLTKAGTGTLNLTGNNIYTGATTVSAGVLNVSGNNAPGGALTVEGAAGTSYKLSGGNNVFTAATFGNSTNGAYVQTSGTTTINNGAGADVTTIGNNAGAQGSMTISGGSFIAYSGAINQNDFFYVGFNGSGTLTISGANTDVEVDRFLVASNATGSSGLVSISSGTLGINYGGSRDNAIGTSGTGILNQTGGVVNFTPATGGFLDLGYAATGNGQINISAGTFNIGTSSVASVLRVGNDGTGSLSMSGGALNSWGDLHIGRDTGSVGTVSLTGGTVTMGPAAKVYVGESGTATMTVGGGTSTATLYAPVFIDVGFSTGGSGTVNLETNGLVQAKLVQGVSGTSTFNFNGGTLQAISTGTLMQSLTTANVRNGGAIIDSNGFSDTISQALTHSNIVGDNATDGGLTKLGAGTLVLTGANTYTGDTTVNVGELDLNHSGGGALTASNVNVNGGTVKELASNQISDSNSVAVNSGTFSIGTFNDTVSGVKFAGGNITGTTGTLTSASNIDAQAGLVSAILAGSTTSVGLNKTTSGTVTLTGQNLYSGATTVSAGELDLNASSNAISSNLVVSGGIAKELANNQINDANSVTVNSGTFTIGTFNDTVSGVKITGGSIASTTGTLTSTSNIDAQAGSVSAILAGSTTSVGLNKTTSGAAVLTGNNLYTGTTTVSAGMLYANNAGATGTSATGSGVVAVKSGGTLGGSGRVGGAVTVEAGGTLASGAAQNLAGNTVDGTHLKLTSDLNIAGGGNLTFALGAGASTGALNFASPNLNSTYLIADGHVTFGLDVPININLVDLTAVSLTSDALQLHDQNPYLLIDASSEGLGNDAFNLVTTGGYDQNGLVLGIGSGPDSGILNSFNLTMHDTHGNNITTTANYSNLKLYLYNGKLEVVPEPGTWALMLGGLATLLFWQRNKKKLRP